MEKDEIIIACATDDKITFIRDHFGEAGYFILYRLTPDSWEYLKTIPNHATEDHNIHGHGHRHGEIAKAQQIMAHFRREHVDIFLSRRFGPNILKIRFYVLPVVLRGVEQLEEGLGICRASYPALVARLSEPVCERKHLVLS